MRGRRTASVGVGGGGLRLLVVAGCIAGAVVALPATPARAEAAPTRTQPSQVVLPTGEVLALQWSGDLPRPVGRLAADGSPLAVITAGGRVYAIPRYALSYIGSGLDRSLFDLAALAAVQGHRTADSLPVSLTYTRGVVPVPGVRVLSHAGGTAIGLLGPGAAFGTALRTGASRSQAPGTRTPVAGLARLGLRGDGAPTGTSDGTVQPHFPQVSLTIRLTPPAGQGMQQAALDIVNIDDSRRYSTVVGVGPENYVKVSVPKGHYSVLGMVFLAGSGAGVSVLVPVISDYAVSTDGQTATLDAGKATATPSFSVPRATRLTFGSLDIGSTDGVHESLSNVNIFYDTEGQVRVQPTPAPAHGVLEFDVYEHRSAVRGGASPIEYRATDEWLAGIPADLHRNIRTAELVRIDDVLHGDGLSRPGSILRGPIYSGLRGALDSDPSTTRTHVTSYVSGPPSARWAAAASRDPAAGTAGSEIMYSLPVSYLPGSTYRVDWFAQALAPGFPARSDFPRSHCVACRTSDGMLLTPSGELDSDPAHYLGGVGSDGTVTGYQRFQVYRDGKRIVDEADLDGGALPVDAAAHDYRIVETVDRAKLGFRSATRTTSQWTVRSSASSGLPVAAGTDCRPLTTDGACSVVSLLTAVVPLPLTDAGTLPPGTSTFVVTVGHVLGAPGIRIDRVTVATSIAGAAFAPAQVQALGAGRFRVTLRTPSDAVGRPVSIRMVAVDADGSSLTQTILDAYTVRSAS